MDHLFIEFFSCSTARSFINVACCMGGQLILSADFVCCATSKYKQQRVCCLGGQVILSSNFANVCRATYNARLPCNISLYSHLPLGCCGWMIRWTGDWLYQQFLQMNMKWRFYLQMLKMYLNLKCPPGRLWFENLKHLLLSWCATSNARLAVSTQFLWIYSDVTTVLSSSKNVWN